MVWRIIGVLLLAASAMLFGADSIRGVDFKNFAYPCDEPLDGIQYPMEWLEKVPKTMVRLKDGLHAYTASGRKEIGREYLEFWRIAYGDLNGDGREEAAVDLFYSTGGTAHWDYLYVYTLRRGKPKLLGVLQSGYRGYGGLYRLQFRDGLLVLDFADEAKATADCCSTGFVRVSYRLERGRFVESRPREYHDFPRKPQPNP